MESNLIEEVDPLVKVIAVTMPTENLEFLDQEELISYCARVSNPNNQLNTATMNKLLKYLATNKHWSPFEMSHAVLEINTSRGISPQILRHRSFSFQEFSQRYQSIDDAGIVVYAARRQDEKNRQNSVDDLSDEIKKEWEKRQTENWATSFAHYKWAIDNNIAKECARFVLPLGTQTKLYMAGSIRSWMHYLEVREHESSQKEHRDIALACREALSSYFPTIFGDLNE